MSNFIYALNATIPVFLVILLGGLFSPAEPRDTCPLICLIIAN